MDCVNPRVVEYEGHYIDVPCGMCILCRIARTREWATRLQFENSMWKESVFVTLTYDDEHLPVSNCGVPTLVKSDLQKFFKRLRSYFHKCAVDECDICFPDLLHSDDEFKMHVKDRERRFKYFACGEYGDHTERSHYHAIIFGLSVKDVELFQRFWYFGFVKVGGVSPQSIRYVTGYVRKKLVTKSLDPSDFSCLHRVPEFQICSEGLGLSFYEKFRDQIFRNGSVRINGHDESIPRYFLKKDDRLRLSLKGSELIFQTRKANLIRAQEILNMRAKDGFILDEMRKSAIQRAKTEDAKNRLFKKGSL